MEYSGGKRPLVQCPFPQIQTEVRHNTFQSQDAEIPCYFSRTNQDAYFHPAYQDERDQCWRQRRNKTNSLQWEKWDEETLLSTEENSVFFFPQVKFYQCQIYLINRVLWLGTLLLSTMCWTPVHLKTKQSAVKYFRQLYCYSEWQGHTDEMGINHLHLIAEPSSTVWIPTGPQSGYMEKGVK